MYSLWFHIIHMPVFMIYYVNQVIIYFNNSNLRHKLGFKSQEHLKNNIYFKISHMPFRNFTKTFN